MTDHIPDAGKKVDKIIATAIEAGFGNYAYEAQSMFERFYAIAYRHGMERAAEICEARKHITPDWQLDQHYNQACAHCAAAIRAHAQNQPKNEHDGSVV